MKTSFLLRALSSLWMIIFLSLSDQAEAVFGTIVTPFEFHVQLQQDGKALPEKVIAFHQGNSGAEPFWPWRTHFTSDANGHVPAFDFSQHGAVTVLTKRLRETKLLIALNTKSAGVQFYALEVKVGRLGTSVHCYGNQKNDPDDLVYKRGELTDCGPLRFSAKATATRLDNSPAWRVQLVIDMRHKAFDLL
jgi:hypothetical protein